MTFLKMLAAGVKAILNLLATGLKIVYNVLKYLRIRLLALYLLVCGLLQLCFGVFDGKAAYFWVGFALCAAVTLAGWGVRLYKRFAKFVPRKRTEEPAEEEEPAAEAPAPMPAPTYSPIPAPGPAPAPAPAPMPAPAPPKPSSPRYFEVEGHAGYYFAEYDDRYELYRRTEHGDELLRTDEKNGESHG